MMGAFAVILLLALCPVVSGYGKNDNTLLETEEKPIERRGRKPILTAISLEPVDQFRIKVDLEWSWYGSREEESYVEINQDNEGYVLAKYPIKKPWETSMFLYLFYSKFMIRVKIGETYSNAIEFKKPRSPASLYLVNINVNKNDQTKRDFEFRWKKHYSPNPFNEVLRTWFKRRERKFDLIDGYTFWQTVKQPYAQPQDEWNSHFVLTALPNRECEFTAVAENTMGISDIGDYQNIITIDGPEQPPLELTLVQISISDFDNGKDNKRNFNFTFYDVRYNKINKLRQIQFEIRVGKDNYTKTWGPWQNHTPLDFSSNAKHASIVLPDYPTYELPAIQFRAMSIAYVGTSKKFSNIVTVVRPSLPPENLKLVGISRSFEDTEDVNKRDFDFEIDNHYYPINKIIRLRFQYRIYRLANFQTNTTEKWQDFHPDVGIDSGRLHAKATITDIKTSDFYDQYLKIEFRAMAVAYVGVSDPGNIVFADVPESPRNLNYIYYGIDVECYTKAKCEMEFDFGISRYSGTFEILDYIIQAKYYSSYDKKKNWKANTIVPENLLHYKRQFIHFDYYNSYRVCARNVFGTSLPSNVLFDSSHRFRAYALNVSYVKHPNDTKAINLNLFWEAFINRDIHN